MALMIILVIQSYGHLQIDCPFHYCSCDLCLYNRLSSRSNVSYRTARVLPSHLRLVNGTVGWKAASKKRRPLAMIIILRLVWAFVLKGRKMILADF